MSMRPAIDFVAAAMDASAAAGQPCGHGPGAAAAAEVASPGDVHLPNPIKLR